MPLPPPKRGEMGHFIGFSGRWNYPQRSCTRPSCVRRRSIPTPQQIRTSHKSPCLENLLEVCLDVHLEVILMAKVPEIIPVTDLRQDAASVLKRVQTSHQPLVITQRGRAAAIMLSVDAYERGERERQLLWLLVRGEQEIAAGVGHGLDEVLAEADALITDGAS